MRGSSGRRTRMGGGDAISVQQVRRKTHRGRKEEGGETVRTGLVRVVGADSLSVSESPKRCPLGSFPCEVRAAAKLYSGAYFIRWWAWSSKPLSGPKAADRFDSDTLPPPTDRSSAVVGGFRHGAKIGAG